MKRAASVVAAVILLAGCAALKTRWRWASMGDMPLICCGGPGNYVQLPNGPTLQEAGLAYIQIVNLPGGCGSFGSDTKAGKIAEQIEVNLDRWSRYGRGDGNATYSSIVAEQLKELKAETIKAGPSGAATHGPPCFATQRKD